MKKGLAIAGAIYGSVGLMLGSLLGLAIPAINVLGVFWYALLWPGFVSAGAFHTPSPPVPAWCFSFTGIA